MPRPRLHSADSLLDATRELVLEGGSSAATIAAIVAATGAPSGSIYHAFGSRENLLVRLWVRAAQRSQVRFLDAAEVAPDARAAVIGAALSVFDFAREQFPDARLLASMRREDLLGSTVDPNLARTLEELNRPLARALGKLTMDLTGRRTAAARDAVALAAIDLPHGAIRRHLVSGRRPPAALREPLEGAVMAAIDAATAPARQPRG